MRAEVDKRTSHGDRMILQDLQKVLARDGGPRAFFGPPHLVSPHNAPSALQRVFVRIEHVALSFIKSGGA